MVVEDNDGQVSEFGVSGRSFFLYLRQQVISCIRKEHLQNLNWCFETRTLGIPWDEPGQQYRICRWKSESDHTRM